MIELLFFVLIIIQVNDIDRSNNRQISNNPVQINLTPPSNLIVQSVIVASSTFSGIVLFLFSIEMYF